MHDSSDDTPNGRPSPSERPPRDSAIGAKVVRTNANSGDASAPARGPLKISGSLETTMPWDDDAPTSEPTDLLIGMTLGEYVVKRRLGTGGMGLVYEAEQPMIGRRVAIKVLKPELTSNPDQTRTLLAEARASNAIRHRGIIDIFGFGLIPGVGQYLVMEYLEGEALDELIHRRAPMIAPDAIPILDETLAALSAAHAEGVIHRDLKPSNIFMVSESTGTSYVKLLDFGLARQAQVPHGLAHQTRASVMVGTAEYMAPEQACGQAVGPMSDLYALGVIAFEMLTGRLPFLGKHPLQVATAQVNDAPPRPSGFAAVPPDLDALIMDLLEKAPEQRPVSAEVVRQRLKRINIALASERTHVGVDPKRRTGPRAAFTDKANPAPAAQPMLKAPPTPGVPISPSVEGPTTPEQPVERDTDRAAAVVPDQRAPLSAIARMIAAGVVLFLAALSVGYLIRPAGTFAPAGFSCACSSPADAAGSGAWLLLVSAAVARRRRSSCPSTS